MQLVTTPRIEFLRGLVREIGHNYAGGRVIVAVDGIAGSGTTEFGDELARVFEEAGRGAFRASIEGFHRPRTERYRLGRESPRGYYESSYDYRALRRALIDPFRMAGSTGFSTTAFDMKRDAPVVTSWLTGPADLVLIIDGVFLLRPELRAFWDFSIHLDVSLETAYERLAKSAGRDPDPAAPSNARYVGGQELYFAESAPLSSASAAIDNTDPSRPRRIFADSC
jgi:uridine kinase